MPNPERKHREEARDLLGFEPPRPHDHDQSPHDHLAHQWLETGDENNLMGPLRQLPAVAQALAQRDAQTEAAHERVLQLASALQDMVSVASNLYAWDWSRHLDDSSGSEDVRRDMRALEQAAACARPLLQRLREEIGEAFAKKWRADNARARGDRVKNDAIDWLRVRR